MPRKPQSYNNTTPVQQFTETAYDAVVICSDNIEDIIRAAGGVDAMALYLGAHPTEPTTGNDGEPLVSGNFFLDTTTSSLKYWDATNTRWIESDVDTIVNAANDAIAARDAAQAAQAASEAAQSASETSATNSANSASASATSASNAAISATNSSNSATASASSAVDSANSATDAEGHATNASTFATNSANSAAASEASNVSAGTHAANAASSETNAATSAVTASNAAAQAEAAFDNFDDMYLGRKTVPPTTDNDGNPLQVGASYWHDNGNNTGEQRFWNGASWESPELTATQAAQQAIAARDDAQVSETNAANSATASAGSAADALLSEQAASASASSASTLADEAAASEQAAFNSANAAATSETNAGTHATNAANSATAASNSATAAANSATEAANTVATFEWQKFVRGEAKLNQMREQNKAPRAASGFDHYGQGYTNNTNAFIVNEGLWTNETQSNVLRLGRGQVTTGESETPFPVTAIAGFVSQIIGANQVDNDIINSIKFPAAPNGTVIYDSSGSARGTGNPNLNLLTDVDPRYGDVAGSVNEAVARAFEGQSPNFNFRNGSAHWALFGGADIPADYLIIAGVNSYAHNSLQNVTPDRDYIVEIVCDRDTVTNMDIIVYSSDSTKAANKTQRLYEGLNRIYVNSSDFNQNYGSANILRIGNVAAIIDSAVVRVATEEVVIDRHDMFGGEFFLEEVSLANPFVYPKGMIQSQLASMNGITTTNSSRPVTYYAVYEGDTESVGKGVDFFAATTQQKIDMVSDETNNIFMLSDGRIVQWRMRQRTIAGAGNGDWLNIDPNYSVNDSGQYLLYAVGSDVNPQGIKDVAPVSDGSFPAFTSATSGQSARNTTGVFDAVSAVNTPDASSGVDGECYLHVWGVVRRLNQGAFHPSYNPLGADMWIEQGVELGDWWTNDKYGKSAAHCFTIAPAGGTGRRGVGNISQGANGREDNRYYDAIYEGGDGGVNDHRLSAFPMDSKEEASKVFQKVVNGTYRGEEKLVKTFRTTVGTTTGTGTGRLIKVGALDIQRTPRGIGEIYLHNVTRNESCVVDNNNNEFLWLYPLNSVFGNTNLGNWEVGDDILVLGVSNTSLVGASSELWTGSSVSGEFTMTNVIGDPAEIVATPELTNGWQGEWIPVIPDGSSTLNYKYTRKLVGSNAISVLAKDNQAGDWRDDTSGWNANFSVITNNRPANLLPVTSLRLITYTAWAKMTRETSEEKKVFNGAEGVGYVFASEHYNNWTGVHLGESLMSKILTNSGADYFMGEHSITNLNGIFSGLLTWTSSDRDAPEHTPIIMDAPNNNSPAFKTLWYQTAESGQVNLFLPFNELVHSGNLPFNNADNTTIGITQGQLYMMHEKDVGNASQYGLNGRILKANGTNSNFAFRDMFIGADGQIFYYNPNGISYPSRDISVKIYEQGDEWGDDSRIKIRYGSDTYENLNGAFGICGTHELSKPIGYTKNHARVSEQVEGVDL